MPSSFGFLPVYQGQVFLMYKAQMVGAKANQSVFLLVGLLFRVIAFWLYPGFDEAYYYLYSLHLDWSYFDHPVLVAQLALVPG